MPMSTTNRTRFALVREASFGVTPANPVFINGRWTSHGLAGQPETVISNEIRPDRQVTDLILVGRNVSGDCGFELSHACHDAVLEMVFCDLWQRRANLTNASPATTITDVAAATDIFTVAAGGAAFPAGALLLASGFGVAANNGLWMIAASTATAITVTGSLTDEPVPPVGATLRWVGIEAGAGDIACATGPNRLTSTVLDFTTLGLAAGDWLKIGGAAAGQKFATLANNSYVRIAVDGIAAHALTLDVVPAGWAADAGAAKTIRLWLADRLVNGVAEISASAERAYEDIGAYEYFTGLCAGSLSLDLKERAIATASVNFMGSNSGLTTARLAGASDQDGPQNFVLNTSSNVGLLVEGGAAVSGPNFIRSIGVTLNNNLRDRRAIQHMGTVGFGWGEFGAELQISTYFGTIGLAEKVMANQQSSVAVQMGRENGDREGYLLDFVAVKYGGGAAPVPGKNQDVVVDLKGTAYRHADLGYTAKLMSFFYTEA